MKNLRIYGQPPFWVVVLHGGPGTPGYMAPVARELAADWGVLEPLQTATSVDGQVAELRATFVEHGDQPATLIGSSWGAMLGYLFAAHYPELVHKLILVGSAVYEDQYATQIMATRLDRLGAAERQEAEALMTALSDPSGADKDFALARLGRLLTKADAYDPLTLDIEVLEHQYDLHQSVWRDAEGLRRSGTLLELGKRIECPVVALHGDYDPHTPEGVQRPLVTVLRDFRFVSLPKCGHLPWIERHARESFFAILREELGREAG
jgi:pimeloyl-ACP methyl ester carboxylesterase